MSQNNSQTPRYRKFQNFLDEHFSFKVQKISVNAGFSCPNRDGTSGKGGCTYCNNQSFNPEYCHTTIPVSEQLESGKRFFGKKYPNMKYLAYFQAYTNTYGTLEHLKKLYSEALAVPDVVGLVIGTRPDCVPESLLEYLEEVSKKAFVLVEYGMESTLDKTLIRINRGHNQACTEDAIRRTAAHNIPVGVHLILGLPGECKNDILHHAEVINTLPVQTIKLHQLQLIKGTELARQYSEDPSMVEMPSAEDYLELVLAFVEHLRPDIAIERFVSQSPPDLLIAPNWGLKNYEFTHLLEKNMQKKNILQGKALTIRQDIPLI